MQTKCDTGKVNGNEENNDGVKRGIKKEPSENPLIGKRRENISMI